MCIKLLKRIVEKCPVKEQSHRVIATEIQLEVSETRKFLERKFNVTGSYKVALRKEEELRFRLVRALWV